MIHRVTKIILKDKVKGFNMLGWIVLGGLTATSFYYAWKESTVCPKTGRPTKFTWGLFWLVFIITFTSPLWWTYYTIKNRFI